MFKNSTDFESPRRGAPAGAWRMRGARGLFWAPGQPILVRCRVVQGPRPRPGFPPGETGGGAGMVLGSSSARYEYVTVGLLLLWIAICRFLTSKAGFQLLVLPLSANLVASRASPTETM